MRAEPWLGAPADTSPELFRAVAEPIRRRLMERLVSGPAGPGELAALLELPRVNVSHHLSVLAAAGLVEQRQRQAAVVPEALFQLRRYFDLALSTTVITFPEVYSPVTKRTHR